MSHRSLLIAGLLTIVGLLLLFLSVWLAPTPLTMTLTAEDAQVLLLLRLPRITLAFIAGGTLAMSGAVFQALFKNPLASPYTLGVSAGSAFGASLAIVFGLTLISPSFAIFAAALAGGLASSALVLWIGFRSFHRTETLILAGVVLTFLFGSVSLFLQYLSDYAQVFALSRWMMGSVGIVGWDQLLFLTPCIILGSFWLIRHAAALDILMFGDEFSFARGVDAAFYSPRFVCLVSLLCAMTVAVCGPIGFVGILVPHSIRLLNIRRHRLLLPVSFFTGGVFLAVSDALARTIAFPYELPVGILTALIGSPLFLILLLRRPAQLSAAPCDWLAQSRFLSYDSEQNLIDFYG